MSVRPAGLLLSVCQLSACGSATASTTYPALSQRAAVATTLAATVNAASSSAADQAGASWEGCLADGAVSEYLIRNSENLGTAVQGRVHEKLPDADEALNTKPYRYEGVFIEVDGPRGTPVNAGGDAIRAAVGGEWDSQGFGNAIPRVQ